MATTATLTATVALARTDDGFPPRARMAVNLDGIVALELVDVPFGNPTAADALTDEAARAIAEDLFRLANIGDGEWSAAYRGRGARSLSVGDVVVVALQDPATGEQLEVRYLQVLGCGYGDVDPLEAAYLLA